MTNSFQLLRKLALACVGLLALTSAASAQPTRLAPRSWITTDPLVYPVSDASHPVSGIKDPSVVFHNGRWHVFATTAGSNGWSMGYYNFASWDEAPAATPFYLDNNPNLAGYNAAPQVFYFRPQNKWYLIFQSAHPRFSTTTNIADPMSWSAPQNFFAGTPASVVEGWLDYWIICDDTHAYLFFPDDHGRLYRSRTTLANFPNGFDEPVVILQEADPADLFEGSCVYRIKDTNQFLLLVECIGTHRYYRAWVADSLDGAWTPLPGADSEATPFAGDANVRTSDGSLFWSEGVSHGELLREGSDETMTLDPENIRFLYQGFARGANPPDYVLLPYHLALLESAPALPSLQTLLLFNEASGTTAADSTVNIRHGTLVNGPTRVTGKGGNAVDLDGTNDHVSLPTGVVSSLIDFTLSTWVNLDAASPGSRIFDFGSGTTNYMFLTPANGATGTVRFAITTSGGGGEQQINGTSALPTGVWTHVAVTVAGNLGILYVNGVEVGRNEAITLTAMSLGATTQNWIGRSQYSDPYLNGRVDDFRIYGNALAASDVLALFNGAAGALAGPWVSQDIGSVGLPGSSGSPGLPGHLGSPGDDIYVTASGGDIWGGSDEFRYVSRTWTGDGTLTARVNVAVADIWSKAGLMFRESLSANSRNAFLTVTPGTNGINFQTRSSTGGGTASSGVGAPAVPHWLKLQRVGNVFTPYHSRDGITWTQTATPVTVPLPTTCYVGFASTAHNNTLLTAAQFDNIALVDTPPAPPSALAAMPGNAQVALSWNASGGATSYQVKRSTTSGSGYVTIATGVAATSFADTGLINGTTYYYVVAATNVYGVSPDSTEASATPIIELKLTGAVIGSSGSWGNSGNTIAKAFDGNTSTFYDAVNATGDWAGLDLGSGTNGVVKQIRYCPRVGWAGRMVGGQFQGSNVADFSSGVVTLFTVASTPPEGTMTVQAVTNTTSFRYLRYIGPANAFCDVAEVEFWRADDTPPAAPSALAAMPGHAQVALSWNASSDATSYNVKRSTTSGSGYVTIATGVAATSFADTGLINGTTYYYVVAATNANGVSPDSTEASATPALVEIFGWWKFDATSGTTAADSGYGGNPGTLQSGATWGVGTIGNAVRLDGTANGYASLPSGLVGALNDFTISTWVKVDANATWARVFDFGSGTGAYMFLSPASGGGSVRYAITNGGGEQQLNRAGNLSTGVWHHLAVTLSGSTGVLYVDGVAANTNPNMTLKPSSLGSTTQNYIGKSQWSDPNLNGSVDDFRIYNRALSASEVAALANPVPATGLAAVSGNAQVALNWNAAPGATSYNVKRATVSGGAYTTIASGITSTSYTDTGLTNGDTYYYVVTTVNTAGESAPSSEASATPVSVYQEWKLLNGLSLSLPDTATPDNDGVPILLKYATGLTPGTPSLTSPTVLSVVNNTLTLQFTRLTPAPVNYMVESSTDLSTWTTIATLPMARDTWTGPASVAETGTGEARTTTVTDTQTIASSPRRFLRLRVDVNAPLADPSVAVMPMPGFNLGNTLESTWGYAPPTKALIDSIADAGFKTLRVPCAWDFNSTNGTINPEFMTQVANVVDWALARGMYVIINCHWDGGWFERDDFDTYKSALNSKNINIWTQVANRFKWHNSDRLSFACANEPGAWNQTQFNVLYQYYQNWITAMRANGGGNATRWLIVQAGSPWYWPHLLNHGLNMPDDPAQKLMIETHTYEPGDFTVQGSDEDWRPMTYFWGSGYLVSGDLAYRNSASSQQESFLQEEFAKLKTAFADRGYPVLIGEWAAQPKPALAELTGLYKEQNFRSVTYYNKFVDNLIRSFGFSGTYFAGQGDTFHPTTGAVQDQDKLNSILGISALPPIPGL